MPQAFPSNRAAIEDFNRANVDPIDSPWAAISGLGTGRIISNAYSVSAASGVQGAYLTTVNHKDMDLWVEISARWGVPRIAFRQSNADVDSSRNGYEIRLTQSLILYRIDAGVPTVLDFVSFPTPSGGESVGVGVRAIGTLFRLYGRGVGETAYTERFSHTDATYNQSGRISLLGDDSGMRIDSLNGGAYRPRSLVVRPPFMRV